MSLLWQHSKSFWRKQEPLIAQEKLKNETVCSNHRSPQPPRRRNRFMAVGDLESVPKAGTSQVDSAAFEKGLEAWQNDPFAKSEHRAEACQKILENFQKRQTSLNLSGLRLTGLPYCIGSLSQLDELDLGYNEMKDLPAAITNLGKGCSIYLEGNPLSEIALDQLLIEEEQARRSFGLDNTQRRLAIEFRERRAKFEPWYKDYLNEKVFLILSRYGVRFSGSQMRALSKGC
jgi:hypothetical protein